MISLDEKQRLIDELIAENPDYTIREYLDWLEEFDRIGGFALRKKPVVIWSFEYSF